MNDNENNEQVSPSQSLRTLEAACGSSKIEGLEFEWFDQRSKFLAKVSFANKFFYSGAKSRAFYSLNRADSAWLVTDKAYTNLILQQAGLNTCEGDYYFGRKNPEEFNMPGLEQVLHDASKLNYPVFLKPNKGSQGRGAQKCNNAHELILGLSELTRSSPVILLQKNYDLPEFRVFCIDSEIQFVYERERSNIIGDGIKTIYDLLIEKYSVIPEKLKLSLDEVKGVPNKNEIVFLGSTANISQGGHIKNIQTKNFSDDLKRIAQQATSLLGLRVLGLDYFYCNDTNRYIIIEVNSNPSLTGMSIQDHTIAEKVWHNILQKWVETETP